MAMFKCPKCRRVRSSNRTAVGRKPVVDKFIVWHESLAFGWKVVFWIAVFLAAIYLLRVLSRIGQGAGLGEAMIDSFIVTADWGGDSGGWGGDGGGSCDSSSD
jgi:hypothetical protein